MKIGKNPAFKPDYRGFTIVELLVVIAVISILSAIVLGSLGSARSKALDAHVQSELSSMRGAAEIYYASKGSYKSVSDNVCNTGDTDTTGLYKLLTDVTTLVTSTNLDCAVAADGSAYSAAVKLPSGSYWCVDSTGVSRGNRSAAPYAGLYSGGPGVAPFAHNGAANSITVCN
jgi:prepilin-type N-terminal cleavage/methylation domain-containing protein